jgi:hypothetical protein
MLFDVINPIYPITHPSRIGLIVTSLSGVDLQFDPNYDLIVVIFNVDKQIQSNQILKS